MGGKVSDRETRALERSNTDDARTEAHLLRRRMRTGDIQRATVEALAFLKHKPAKLIIGEPDILRGGAHKPWAEALGRHLAGIKLGTEETHAIVLPTSPPFSVSNDGNTFSIGPQVLQVSPEMYDKLARDPGSVDRAKRSIFDDVGMPQLGSAHIRVEPTMPWHTDVTATREGMVRASLAIGDALLPAWGEMLCRHDSHWWADMRGDAEPIHKRAGCPYGAYGRVREALDAARQWVAVKTSEKRAEVTRMRSVGIRGSGVPLWAVAAAWHAGMFTTPVTTSGLGYALRASQPYLRRPGGPRLVASEAVIAWLLEEPNA